MLVYPKFDPVILHIYGPFAVRWYGLMYLLGLFLAWLFLSLRIKYAKSPIISATQLVDMLFYAAVGMILGGRLGYMLFYNWQGLVEDPLSLVKIWQGGMSFHGGLLGVFAAVWLYARYINRGFLQLTDFLAPAVPLGLAAGRIGNFINGELWGRVTTMPWGMVFPEAGPLPRHPSQLYEFFLEGLLLFCILWLLSRNNKPTGVISACFLLFYGALRFFVEFFRAPDWQKGFVAFGWMSEGQLLSIPMCMLGVVILLVVKYRGVK